MLNLLLFNFKSNLLQMLPSPSPVIEDVNSPVESLNSPPPPPSDYHFFSDTEVTK